MPRAIINEPLFRLRAVADDHLPVEVTFIYVFDGLLPLVGAFGSSQLQAEDRKILEDLIGPV